MNCFGGLATRFVAVVVFGLGAGTAGADPILQFETFGRFALGTLYDDSNMLASVTDGGTRLGIGDAASGVINTFLVYHAQQYDFDLGSPQFAQPDGSFQRDLTFGYFTLESTDPNGELTYEKYRQFDGAQFTLSVKQISPIVGDGSWTSQLIHGTVWYSEDPTSPGTSSYLGVKFGTPLTFAIPRDNEPNTIRYTIEPTAYVTNPNGQTGQQFGVNGHVETIAAPLPGVAWLGLTLLGGVGVTRGIGRFRRRQENGAA